MRAAPRRHPARQARAIGLRRLDAVSLHLALVALLGCAPSAHPTIACDPAPWNAIRASRSRARLAGGVVTVLASAADRVAIADTARGWVIRTTVSPSMLVPSAIRETPISLHADTPPEHLWLEAGAPLPEPAAEGWVHVHLARGIELDGWVPAGARSLFWTNPPTPIPPRDTLRRAWRTSIHAAPDTTAPAIARLLDDAPVAIIDTAPEGWVRVSASWVSLRFDGWTQPPTSRSNPHVHVYDFSDDIIEDELPRPSTMIAMRPACIHAAPSNQADVIGVLADDATPHLSATGDGWARVELPTPWGLTIGYVQRRGSDGP